MAPAHKFKVKHFAFRLGEDGSTDTHIMSDWISERTQHGWQVQNLSHWIHEAFLMFLVVLIQVPESNIAVPQLGMGPQRRT